MSYLTVKPIDTKLLSSNRQKSKARPPVTFIWYYPEERKGLQSEKGLTISRDTCTRRFGGNRLRFPIKHHWRTASAQRLFDFPQQNNYRPQQNYLISRNVVYAPSTALTLSLPCPANGARLSLRHLSSSLLLCKFSLGRFFLCRIFYCKQLT